MGKETVLNKLRRKRDRKTEDEIVKENLNTYLIPYIYKS